MREAPMSEQASITLKSWTIEELQEKVLEKIQRNKCAVYDIAYAETAHVCDL